MKQEIQYIITDINAALKIGMTETLWVALEGILGLPEVAGNNEMEEPFLRKGILPLGFRLVNPNLSIQFLEEMQKHPQAAVRAIAAVAIVEQHLQQNAAMRTLVLSAQDSRNEVKVCVSLALAKLSPQYSDEVNSLIGDWLSQPREDLQQVALQTITNINSLEKDGFLENLKTFSLPENPDLRSELVECLANIAMIGFPTFVISYLENLNTNVKDEQLNGMVWVGAKTLSRSWVVDHLEQVFPLLTSLASKTSDHKQLINTLQAISRHSDMEKVREYIKTLPDDQSENLAEFLFVANKLLN